MPSQFLVAVRRTLWSRPAWLFRRCPKQAVGDIPLISCIPIEILSEIFMIYAYSEGRMEDSYGLGLSTLWGVSTNPFVLGQVCGYWRSLVTSMPMLWSSLCIRGPKRFHISLIRLWLNRAGKYPLTIHASEDLRLRYRGHRVMEKTRDGAQLFCVLLEYSQTWRRIDFDMPGLKHPLQILPSVLPRLESVVLGSRLLTHGDTDKIWRAIFRSPSLRRIVWQVGDFEDLLDHTPWAQLTHITFLTTVNGLLYHLQQCTNLEELTINNVSIPLSLTTATLPKLRSLAVDIIEPREYHLFDCLTLPSLESLSIRDVFIPNDGQNSHIVINHLVRSSSQPKEVHLLRMNIEDLLSYLTSTSMTSVSHLEVSAGTNMDHIILALTCRKWGEEYHCLLPRLEHLSLRGSLKSSHEAIRGLIFSREGRDNIVPLTTVLINSLTVEDYFRQHIY